MKFTIHTNHLDQPIGFVYAESEYEALQVVRDTWTPRPQNPEMVTDESGTVLRSGAVRYIARPVPDEAEIARPPQEPTSDDLQKVETDSEEFANLVETEWTKMHGGELLIYADDNGVVDNPELRELAGRMGFASIENVLMVGDGVVQVDAHGDALPGNVVTEQEVARRVATALAVLFYGN